MGYHEHRQLSPKNVSCAVVTISDSHSEADDESGKLIQGRLRDHGHTVADYRLLKNDAAAIQATITYLVSREDVQAIITTGGTGVSHRDVTVDTVEPMLKKKLDGFGELFRQLTHQEIGTGSILSRATGGVIGGTVVLSFPGSLGAATLAMDKVILPELGHMVREATR